MQTSKQLVLVVAISTMCVGTSSISIAQTQETPTAAVTRLGEEIAVLKMEQKKAEIQAKLEELRQKKNNDNHVQNDLPVQGMPSHTGGGGYMTPQEIPPTVIGISTMRKVTMATLRFSNGGQKDINTGDVIEGGYKVAKITSSGVELTRNGKSVWLAPSSR